MKSRLFCLLASFYASISLAQTTSLVVNFDLEGFNDVSYSDSFTMRYANKTDSLWYFEHTFHCPKDFHWSDTISPVPEGDIQVAIILDSVVVLESYYWVNDGRINIYDVTIDRETKRTRGQAFISDYIANGYFRLGTNIMDFQNSSKTFDALSFNSGLNVGEMISDRFGRTYGYGLNYETLRFTNSTATQSNSYNYWSFSYHMTGRFSPFGYENHHKLKRNTYIEIGGTYYLPLKFRYIEKEALLKIQRGKMHNYKDFRVRAALTIGKLAFLALTAEQT